MARRFTVIFEKEDEGGYHVFCPTLPGCHTQSETIEEGIQNTREAIELYIESLTEDGLPIPTEDILIKPIEIPACPESSPRSQRRNWCTWPNDFGFTFRRQHGNTRFMFVRATRRAS